MKVAYQGEPGAYSERAVRSLFADAEPLPCDTVRHAFSRVTSGEASFGVVPLENSQAGSVNETYELLANSSLLRIVGEAIVRVDHALLGVPGARLEDVRRARSHWQALAQCEDFLSAMRIEPVPEHDTAGAARKVAGEGDVATAGGGGVGG
jgi:prephenate dehydratase